MKVSLIDKMGSDLSVVNAARVSFDKVSEWGIENELQEKDIRLIGFLARNNHWTPFAHTSVTLHVKAPIFVVRQLAKHQVGGVINEVSRRYVDSTPEFYMPENWRAKHENKKQGSHEDKFVPVLNNSDSMGVYTVPTDHIVLNAYTECINVYNQLLANGICPEQARMVLPQSMFTEFYWTGSIAFFARVCGLRLKPDAQFETRVIAQQISDLIEPNYPVSWKALTSK